jgi:hypothetical protein
MSYGIENQNETWEDQGTEEAPAEGPTPGQQAWNAVQGPLGMVMSVLGQDSRRNRAYFDSQVAAQNQYTRQRLLNQQGHDLQYDMWKKTSFPAQVRMMKAAGLNPALMYKQGGPGGVTGSQTGGSASKADTPAIQPMDMQNLLLGAEMSLKEAQARNINKDTDLKGKDIELKGMQIKNVNQDTLKKVQETSNLKTQGQLLEFEKSLLELKVKKQVTGSAFVDLLTQVGLDPVNNEWDRNFLQGILVSLGLLRAGGDIAKIWAQIRAGSLPGVDLNKAFNKNMQTNRDFNNLPPVPPGLRIPVPNR